MGIKINKRVFVLQREENVLYFTRYSNCLWAQGDLIYKYRRSSTVVGVYHKE